MKKYDIKKDNIQRIDKKINKLYQSIAKIIFYTYMKYKQYFKS